MELWTEYYFTKKEENSFIFSQPKIAMIVLFLFYLFIHLNGLKCNEIKNLTTNYENGIVATKESIWNISDSIYQSTPNQRRKRANTPPRRSRSRSPLRTPGPNDQQRTPPLQLQPGNPFGVLPFQPPPPIIGQPFMPQPIAGQQPTAPIGPVGQMLPPIGGGQPIGQMQLPLQIMPAAFGPPQQPQYAQHHQPPQQPQNIPQHRSPIAPGPASPIYELQSLYEQPQVYSPQRYRNLSPTQRAIFEDILQDVQIRNPQNIPPHQSPIAHRPATPRYSPLTPESVQQRQQQPQAGQIRVLAPPLDPAFEQYQLRQQELHEQQFHQGQFVNIAPPLTYEQALQHEQQRRQDVKNSFAGPMVIPHQPHAVHQRSPPRGGTGAIHPSPNVPPRTRKRPRSNSVPSRFSGGGPSPPKRGRFGRRKKRNAQFA